MFAITATKELKFTEDKATMLVRANILNRFDLAKFTNGEDIIMTDVPYAFAFRVLNITDFFAKDKEDTEWAHIGLGDEKALKEVYLRDKPVEVKVVEEPAPIVEEVKAPVVEDVPEPVVEEVKEEVEIIDFVNEEETTTFTKEEEEVEAEVVETANKIWEIAGDECEFANVEEQPIEEAPVEEEVPQIHSMIVEERINAIKSEKEEVPVEDEAAAKYEPVKKKAKRSKK